MKVEGIRPGTVVTGSRWPEPVEVKKIESSGGYVHVVGATTLSGQHVDQLIPAADFESLTIRMVATDFGAFSAFFTGVSEYRADQTMAELRSLI